MSAAAYIRYKMNADKKWTDRAWDIWCAGSVIGIWPRFIEPALLARSRLTLPISSISPGLKGLKVLHFSDLHWSRHFSARLGSKLIDSASEFKPDLIFFTGDFLCRAKMEHSAALKEFLNGFKARYGCFAVLGNHDYSEFVSVNDRGDYDTVETDSSDVITGLKRLFFSPVVSGKITDRVKSVRPHPQLEDLLKDTPFTVLKNETETVICGVSSLNVSGVEEYSLGRSDPSTAFKNYNKNYPGIVLTHNPDAFAVLKNYPGDLLLAGHTHGGQINLPWLWKRFTSIEHPEFKRGLKRLGGKWAYVNRGISSVMKFRMFSMPELTLITLE